MNKFIFLIILYTQARLFYEDIPIQPKILKDNVDGSLKLPEGTTCKLNTGKAVFDQLPETQTVLSGYLSVKDGSKSVLSFIFYGSQKATSKDKLGDYPTLIWLNGGPGSSSQMGNFMELGPMYFQDADNKLLNKYSWDTQYNIMFVDQPIGVGYSYFENLNDIPTDQDGMAAHFLYALLQFLTADTGCVKAQGLDKLVTSPWMIFGESYAGKYVPAISEAIINHNSQQGVTKIPLKAAGIGDPFTDPFSVMAEYTSYAYNFGLIDFQERSKAESMILYGLNKVQKGQWVDARNIFSSSLDYIIQQSGNMNVYNVLEYGTYSDQQDQLKAYLNSAEMKTLLGFADDVEYLMSSGDVRNAFYEDFMKSDCIKRLEFVLESIPVLIYNGQNDLICSTPGTLRWVYNLKHAGSDEYKEGDLNVWKVNDKVVGYEKEAKNLKLVLINNAGHLIPKDQAETALEMVKSFVEKYK